MDNLKSNELTAFTQHYVDAWQKRFQHPPKSSELHGLASPCIINTKDLCVFWQPILTNTHTLQIVEEVVQLTINPDAYLFYGTQYAGDMTASFEGVPLSLIQVWSPEDFSRLEQNIIAHLNMQRKLKRRPTIFIATTEDPSQLITIDNQTGQIILEKLIDNEIEILANNLSAFLTNLKPVVR